MRELTIDRRSLFGFRKRRKVMIPESYSELSPAQFVAVVAASLGWINDIQLITRYFDLSEKDTLSLDPWQAYTLRETMEFLKKTQPLFAFIIPQLQAKVDGRELWLEPPGPKLAGMTLQQFMSVDTFCAWYLYSEKREYLYNFIVSLYTDPEIEFGKLETEKYKAAILAHQDNTEEIFQAILVNWILIKRWLSDAYPKLFPHSAPEGKKKTRPSSWLPVFDALVDEDLTRVESYQRLNAIDVIRIINRKIENRKKK